MRQFLAKNSVLVGVVAVLITALCISAVFFFPASSAATLPQLNRAYYYDLAAGKLVEAPDNLIPPANYAGKELVRAMVFACKSCADAQDRAIGFLKSFTPERKAAEENTRKGMAPGEVLPVFEVNRLNALGGALVRSVEGADFVPAESPEADKIIHATSSRCPQTLVECRPL